MTPRNFSNFLHICLNGENGHPNIKNHEANSALVMWCATIPSRNCAPNETLEICIDALCHIRISTQTLRERRCVRLSLFACFNCAQYSGIDAFVIVFFLIVKDGLSGTIRSSTSLISDVRSSPQRSANAMRARLYSSSTRDRDERSGRLQIRDAPDARPRDASPGRSNPCYAISSNVPGGDDHGSSCSSFVSSYTWLREPGAIE